MRERKLCTHMKSSVMLLSIWHDIFESFIYEIDNNVGNLFSSVAVKFI
jgi:hypothetical protein